MEKINMYKKKLSEEREIELKQDLIVPDSKQDIFQMKDSNFYCYLNKVEVVNGRIKVNGNIDTYLSYISSAEENSGLQTVVSFEDVLDNNFITEDMNLQYDINVAKYDIKIINERKVSINITIKMIYEVYGIDSIDILNDFSDIEDVQVLTKKIELSSIIGMNTNIASIKEEIKIDSIDLVADILKIKTDILNKEVKISHNKVLTKADLSVLITYLTKDDRICEVEEKFPLMSFIDIENVNENNVCSTDYKVRNILLNVNNGEENTITIQMEYEITCKAFETKEQDIACDLYSLRYNVDFKSQKIELEDSSINVIQEIIKKEAMSTENNYSMIVYSVKKDDSLWDISKRFRVKQDNVINSNQLEEPYHLKAGEKIYIVR